MHVNPQKIYKTLKVVTGNYSSSSSIFQNIDPQNINSQKYRPSKLLFGKFPGGPLAETLCFQCRVPGFDPFQGIGSHTSQGIPPLLQLRPGTTKLKKKNPD